MIPVQDVVPTGRTPIVTIALIAINAIVFAAQLPRQGRRRTRRGCLRSPSGVRRTSCQCVVSVAFGDNVEARLGRARFACIYLASASSALVASTLCAVLAAVGHDRRRDLA